MVAQVSGEFDSAPAAPTVLAFRIYLDHPRLTGALRPGQRYGQVVRQVAGSPANHVIVRGLNLYRSFTKRVGEFHSKMEVLTGRSNSLRRSLSRNWLTCFPPCRKKATAKAPVCLLGNSSKNLIRVGHAIAASDCQHVHRVGILSQRKGV